MGANSDTLVMQKRLRRDGYEFVRQHGSHKIYRKGNTEIVVNLRLNRMVKKRLMKQLDNNN